MEIEKKMKESKLLSTISKLMFAGASFIPSIAFAGAGGSSGGGGSSSGGGGGGGQTGAPPGMGVDFPPLAFLLGGVMVSVGVQHLANDRERILKKLSTVGAWLNWASAALVGVAFYLALKTTSASMLSIEYLAPFAVLSVAFLLSREIKRPVDLVAAFTLFSVAIFTISLAYFGYSSLLLTGAPLVLAFVAFGLGGKALLHRGALLWACGAVPALLMMPSRNTVDVFLGEMTAFFSVSVLGGLGLQVTSVGQTIHGLAIPVHVTTLCAGAHIVAGAALVSAIVCATFLKRTEFGQLKFVMGFIALSFAVNVARVVAIALIVEAHSAEAAMSSHDLVGYVFTLLLYGALAFSVLKARRSSAQGRLG